MITLWIEQAFSFMINQSLLASWLILAVIVIRTCTNKMPKSLRYVLWVFVAVRLLSPISIESNWSLVPEIQLETKESTPDLHFDSVVVEDVEKTDLSGQQELYELQEIEEQEIEIPNQNVLNQDKSDIVVNAIKEKETSYTSGNTNDGILSMEDVISVGSWIWIIGIFTIGFSSLISVLCLKKKVDVSIQLNENLWVCDEIQSPFIYGLVSPRIYVPSFTTEEQLPSILAHENEHLKYHDHWWKPLGFAILTVHWFNPLIWIAYILFCRDMELACDERVIQHMNEEEKKQYSKSLLMCNNPRYIISACPLAFGEIGVKERIKSILNYRKPSSKIIGIGVFICIILAVCFMTNQKTITLNLDVEKIEKIELRSGMTGNSIEITEKEEILR
ncbi:MAG: M56 family metallopeptidase, partial [Agathobacter sp.]|nr:M56 family metallopeptidase [Agathobacter sp.]